VLTFLFLGFSAGLPFLLVFTTLSPGCSFGVSRTAIGFLADRHHLYQPVRSPAAACR
jgi:hypothetical protein